MITTIFLDNTAKNKLLLLQLLEQKNQLTNIYSLSKETAFSYTKTQHLIEDINQDMIQLFEKSILLDNGKINLHANLPSFSDYQHFLIKKSLNYRFLYEILTNPSASLDEFCDYFYISRASVFRRLQPLKDYLESRDIQLNITQMSLLGSEAGIRSIFFNLLWLVDHGHDFLESLNSSGAEDTIFAAWTAPLSQCVPQEFPLLLLKIARLRIQQESFADKELDAASLPLFDDAIGHFFQQLGLDGKVLNRECAFFYYAILYWPDYYDLQDPRIAYLNAHKRLLIPQQLTGELLSFFLPLLRSTALSLEDQTLLEINLYTTFATFFKLQQLSPVTIDQTTDGSVKQTTEFLRLLKPVKQWLRKKSRNKELKWLHTCLDKVSQACALLLLPYYEFSETEQLLVGVHNHLNYLNAKKIKNYCRSHSYIELCFFSELQDQAFDFVITTGHYKGSLHQLAEEQIYRISETFDIHDLMKQLTAAHQHKINQLQNQPLSRP